jgi:RNA polymerase sigma-70 factor (ECF subfamily)
MAVGREAAPATADSFDAVFNTYRDYVYTLTYAILGNDQDAEDVTQEVFLQVYKALPSYQPERASMRTWLATIAVNACHRYKRYRRRNLLDRIWHRSPPAEENDHTDGDDSLALVDLSIWGVPEDRVLQNEVRQVVKEVLAKLKPEHRSVLILHYYLDHSCAEIAQMINCPEGTVYSRLHHARRLVRGKLESLTGAVAGEGGRQK